MTIDKLKISIKSKNDYYKSVDINDDFFPDISYYELNDISYGVFLLNKNLYQFKWPKIAPILTEYNKLPDLNDLNTINTKWLISSELFNYSKVKSKKSNDNTYKVKYIDNTSVDFKDNKGIISRYLEHLNELDENKIEEYIKYKNEYVKNNENKKDNIIQKKENMILQIMKSI